MSGRLVSFREITARCVKGGVGRLNTSHGDIRRRRFACPYIGGTPRGGKFKRDPMDKQVRTRENSRSVSAQTFSP